MLQIRQSHLEAFLRDPVLATYVFFGAELDVFQQARLRLFWWVPEVVDSSGISTGKTVIDFFYLNLRCILISDHVAGIYFPNFQVGKDEFWDQYFPRYIDSAPYFREQLEFHHNKFGESKMPGAWRMAYRNASKLLMPAPSFAVDSETQATRRFNTLVVDDWLRAEDMGDAIAKQLVDRVTRPSFNQNHPVWANHMKFLGHAETPSHKGYARVRNYKRAITDGSQRHALITFCYLDWTPEFAKKYRVDATINSQKRNLSPDQFERQHLGIWSRDGSAYYPETVLSRSCKAYLSPSFSRVYDNEVNFLGFDTAAGNSVRADWSAAVNYRIVEINDALKAACQRNGIEPPPVTRTVEDRKFNCAFTYAHMFKNLTAGETAAFIHLLYRIFVHSTIGLDPGGGGLWVYPELKNPLQTINGVPQKVVPLCTPDEAITADKIPIVRFFSRNASSGMADLVIPQFLVSDDGFLQAVHSRFRESWEAGEHHWPMPLDDRSPNEVKQWPEQVLWAQRVLDAGLKQFPNIRRVTDAKGNVRTSARGFVMFEAKGKKDVAMAALMAFAAGELWLKGFVEGANEEASEFAMV
jgi:hypothetical protein